MATMRILNPTATRQVECRSLLPFVSTHRLGLLHNHSPDFDRLAEALPQALHQVLPVAIIDTHIKERYSSGAPEAMLRTLSTDYDFVITGLAA